MHHRHTEMGAKMMPAGNWQRPAFYGEPQHRDACMRAESSHVRNKVGLIDVSTLGGIELRGPDAAEFMNRIYTFAFLKQPVGRTRYAVLTSEHGVVIDDGVAWLEGLTDNWAGKNQIVHHLWWHLCLFLLETGEHDRILSLYDREVRNPDSPMVQAVPDAYIDVQNAASLLVRLELRGVDVGERWTPLAEVAEGRIDNHVNPFTSAHAAIILAANGMYERATDLVRSMQEFAVEDDGPLGAAMAQAAIPASLASIAHRKGNHGEVVAQLMPARHCVPLMGGSHAQRDVFFQILMDSCRKLGDSEEIQTLIGEISRIGFAEVPERTLYADAAALVA
jgi:hypothetical protein